MICQAGKHLLVEMFHHLLVLLDENAAPRRFKAPLRLCGRDLLKPQALTSKRNLQCTGPGLHKSKLTQNNRKRCCGPEYVQPWESKPRHGSANKLFSEIWRATAPTQMYRCALASPAPPSPSAMVCAAASANNHVMHMNVYWCRVVCSIT